MNEVANAQNDYQEDAQVRISQILLSENNTSEAKIYLEGLVNSSNVNIKNFANTELMKIYAEEKNFSQAEFCCGFRTSESDKSKKFDESR